MCMVVKHESLIDVKMEAIIVICVLYGSSFKMQVLEWVGKGALNLKTNNKERILMDDITWLQCHGC